MAFTKLKVIVMIALIVFVLMVANTIAFGLLKEKAVLAEDKQTIKLVNVTADKKLTNNTQVAPNTTKTVSNIPAKSTTTTTTTTVKQPRRTRAS